MVPRRESGGPILVTPGKGSVVEEAHMSLGDAAAYRGDLSGALGHYSRVNTALAACNQAQVCEHTIL